MAKQHVYISPPHPLQGSFFEGDSISVRMFPTGEGPHLSVVGSEATRTALEALMEMFVRQNFAGGEGCYAGLRGQFNKTFTVTLLCPGHWARCHPREGTQGSCVPDGVARSAGECSCTFLYLDSVFVKSEDWFDSSVIFPSLKSPSSTELGSRGEGSGRGSGFSPPLCADGT